MELSTPVNKQPEIFQKSIKFRMWKHASGVALFLLMFFLSYVYVRSQTLNPLGISQAIAGTAGVLIGLSFAMSAICYYWDFLDDKIAYRKYYGLVGYWLALGYSVMLLFLFPDKYFFGMPQNLVLPDVLLGLGAMIILTFMTFISRNSIMIKMGPKNWRAALRLGYLAYIFLIVRAYLIEKNSWYTWYTTMDNLPPPRLLLTIFALAVLVMRVLLYFSTHKKQNIKPAAVASIK